MSRLRSSTRTPPSPTGAQSSSSARTPTFAFHPVLTGTPSDATLASIADAVADGTATFKFFTTDLTTTQRGIRLDHGSARALLAECARLGALAMVHAEDDDLIKHMEAKLSGRVARSSGTRTSSTRTWASRSRSARSPRSPRTRRGGLCRTCVRHARTRRDRRAAGGGPADLRRGATQLHVLLARRLRQAGRREVHIGMACGRARTVRRCGRVCATAASPRSRRRVHDVVRVKMAGTDIETTPAAT